MISYQFEDVKFLFMTWCHKQKKDVKVKNDIIKSEWMIVAYAIE